MPVIASIADLKRLHEKRAPRMFFDYCESGSYSEQTFRDNTADFAQIRLRQKVAVDMTGRTSETTMVGQPVAMPVALAPVGSTGMQHPDGLLHSHPAAEWTSSSPVVCCKSEPSLCGLSSPSGCWTVQRTLGRRASMRRLSG